MKRKRMAMVIAVMLAPVAAILSPAAQSARATVPVASASSLVASPVSQTHSRWIVNDPMAFAAAVKSRNWVETPEGLVYKTCVYHVPAGAIVDHGVIIKRDGTRTPMACAHPRLAYPEASSPRTAALPGAAPAAVTGCAAGATNDLFFAYSCADAPTWLNFLSERFSVPADPTVAGVTLFFFPSFEDSTQDTILQPVLTWGSTPYVSNDKIWYITNYYLWPGNPGVAVSNSVHVGPGDTIDGSIVATSCDSNGVNCTWTVESSVEGGAATTPLTVVSGVAMTNVESGAMEVHFANTCAEMPSSNHEAFRNLSVDTHNGSWTPAFQIFYPNRQCSVSETASASGADILWNS